MAHFHEDVTTLNPVIVADPAALAAGEAAAARQQQEAVARAQGNKAHAKLEALRQQAARSESALKQAEAEAQAADLAINEALATGTDPAPHEQRFSQARQTVATMTERIKRLGGELPRAESAAVEEKKALIRTAKVEDLDRLRAELAELDTVLIPKLTALLKDRHRVFAQWASRGQHAVPV